MAIKDDAAFQELAPYLKLIVAPNGVTIGDLAFVCAQTQWSTGLIAPSGNNTFAADSSVSLFQTAIGDAGQGFTGPLSGSETSWKDPQGKLPANQVFIATRAWFQVYLRNLASTTAGTEVNFPVRSIGGLHAIARNFSWETTIGDGMTRPYGSLLEYGGGAQQYGVVAPGVDTAGVAATPTNPIYMGQDLNAQLGAPGQNFGRQLRMPFVFPPNIGVNIKVKCGASFLVPTVTKQNAIGGPVGGTTETIVSTEFLAVRLNLAGYLCTMPVA